MPSWSGDDDVPFDPSPRRRRRTSAWWPIRSGDCPACCEAITTHAFAAAGPEAARITADPLPLPPHIPESPVGRVHDLDGQVLLLGVGHDADTTLHLAELLAGVPYRVPTSLHRAPRRTPGPDRLRGERPLLRALRLRGRVAPVSRASGGRARRARACAARARPGYRRGCARPPGPRPAPVSPSPERGMCRMRQSATVAEA